MAFFRSFSTRRGNSFGMGHDRARGGGAGAAPRHWAADPLFAPLAPWLARLDGTEAPAPAWLDALAGEAGLRPRSGGGVPVHFVAPPADGLGYEPRIHATGRVATRPGDWHDAFNALAWLAFPRTKAALNARHCHGPPPPDAGRRGPLRDAATQFDECGVAVLSSEPALLALLAEQRWKELFWERRAAVGRSMRFVVVGHGLYDALRRPFFGLCGKAALIAAAAELPDWPVAAQVALTDRVLAARLADPRCYAGRRAFPPLPLLGIPGLVPDSADPRYYDDTRQFRRGPPAREG